MDKDIDRVVNAKWADFKGCTKLTSTKDGSKCTYCKSKYDLLDDGDYLRCWMCGSLFEVNKDA